MRNAWGARAGLAASLFLLGAPGCGPEAEPGAPVAGAPTSRPWLVDVTQGSGIDFVHETGAAGNLHLPEIMGGGAALLDVDGDGDLDAFLTNGGHEPGARGASPAANRLFRQEAGGTFVDVTAASGLAGDSAYGLGVAAGDADNDGDLDLYLTGYGADRFYRNRGDGSFEDATDRVGAGAPAFSTSAVFCDYDADGWLDLYVARYVRYDPKRRCADAAGRRDYCTPLEFEPEPDLLLHNDGDGGFTDVTLRAGIAARPAAGLGVVCDDFDGDGLQDFYVANDKHANQLWINQGGGVFRDQAVMRGAAYGVDGRAEAGMGVVAADLDGDGDVDLHVTNIENEANTVYRNLGGGLFEDATAASGLVPPTLPLTGFGVAAADLDLDGDLDLLVANGRVLRRGTAAAGPGDPWEAYAEPNLLLANDSGVFAARADLAPDFTRPRGVSRGLATGDVDGDGDVDLLLARAQSTARLYRNDAPRRGTGLLVRAFDPDLDRDAVGARVSLAVGGKTLVRTVSAGGSYLSSNDLRTHFGFDGAVRPDWIEVRWPDGRRERFGVEPADRVLTVRRGQGRPVP